MNQITVLNMSKTHIKQEQQENRQVTEESEIMLFIKMNSIRVVEAVQYVKITNSRGEVKYPIKVLAASKNPILEMANVEAASILLVGPTLKKFNDIDLSPKKITICKKIILRQCALQKDGSLKLRYLDFHPTITPLLWNDIQFTGSNHWVLGVLIKLWSNKWGVREGLLNRYTSLDDRKDVRCLSSTTRGTSKVDWSSGNFVVLPIKKVALCS
ncbi:outer arm dynein light chain 1 protein [Artemisia annua]|uniref:Outer arm dynein light chain 1 protein n=1 Tax=Artemisia annua TaxID=35608 RepID=A0A2U1N462_ARTAN|nr:outer arm dynein light chain 1 protein [Artemisia annua]